MVGKRARVPTDEVSIDAAVSLIPIEGGRFQLGAELRVALPSVTDEQAADLVRTAHQICPYSNATRNNITVTLVANGSPA